MHHADVRGLSIAYECAGQGPPLVLLHGILGDARQWAPQVAGLSDAFRVTAWDAPGAGRSSDPPEPFAMADWADALAGVLDAAGADRAHVVGLSWGGILAQEFYRRHAGRVRSLVLAGAYAGWGGSLSESARRERLESCLRQSRMPAEAFVPDWIPGLFGDAATDEVRERLAAILSDFHPAGFRLMARAIVDLDTRDLLPEIRVPTLLLWGEADARAPLAVARAFRDAIPDARLAIIPDAGHVSNLERPARFNAAVRRFCEAVDAG